MKTFISKIKNYFAFKRLMKIELQACRGLGKGFYIGYLEDNE